MGVKNADLCAGLKPANPSHAGHLGASGTSDRFTLVLASPEGKILIDETLTENEAFRVITYVEAARTIEKGFRGGQGVHGENPQEAEEVKYCAVCGEGYASRNGIPVSRGCAHVD